MLPPLSTSAGACLFLFVLALVGCSPDSIPPKDDDLDGDGFVSLEDCDDSDPWAYPGALEQWYDGVDQDCGGNDDYDRDGDGFVPDAFVGLTTAGLEGSGALPGGDCWDDSTELPKELQVVSGSKVDRAGNPLNWVQPAAAEVHPGAPDTWYDGVDQDCAGDDDFDQDLDGYATFSYPNAEGIFGGDCLDGDPLGTENPAGAAPQAVNPGAAERWYDGTDDNCDGNDCDADSDGWSADGSGGGFCADQDCDDQDASAFPGSKAAETWYDGIDTDCDGNDGDQDGDGFWALDYDSLVLASGSGREPLPIPKGAEGDCDDTSNLAFPGAEEIWYDGADQDCAGGDDYDADADGWPLDKDCDDTEPEAHPGGVEVWYDTIDQDCDGNDCDRDLDLVCLEGYTGTIPRGYTGGDCNDLDPGVNPLAMEIAADGRDQDCDGRETCFVDQDHDGYRAGEETLESDDLDCDDAPEADASADEGDCDDSDPRSNPGMTEIVGDERDQNCDTFELCFVDADFDGYPSETAGTLLSADLDCADEGEVSSSASFTDCDDTLREVAPGADEYCNGRDDDCDGEVDETGVVDGRAWYADLDGDGYGDPAELERSCGVLVGRVEDDRDCDDSSSLVSPGSLEYCDGVDNDCDGLRDEADAEDAVIWYIDSDHDGYGDSRATTIACDPGLGWARTTTDCDDTSADIWPGAPERCNDRDDDCDGGIDEEDVVDAPSWYQDRDADGFGDPAFSVVSCDGPEDWVALGTDCDDSSALVYPGAVESVGDGVDQDCDGGERCYLDNDDDGWRGSSGATLLSVDRDCSDARESSALDPATDCEDNDPTIHPGATERPGDETDQDCDGRELCHLDADADGYRPSTGTIESGDLDCDDPGEAESSLPSGDCDDTRADVRPGAPERCDGLDDDCDGEVDESDALDASSWYHDADLDRFGDPLDRARACVAPSGYIADNSDCDDTRAGVNPLADELCNGLDDNCDASIDEDSALDAGIWYRDSDDDSYGVASSTHVSCAAPEGWVADDTDCDDSESSTHPSADERCDGLDQDCDGLVDEDGAIDAPIWYLDLDLDGYGDASSARASCERPEGWLAEGDDCDDTRGDVHPGATEATGDSLDQDCDGRELCYLDQDDDGFRPDASSTLASLDADCLDAQEALATEPTTDCDDADDRVHPGAAELLGDGVDQDCDGGERCASDADDDGWRPEPDEGVLSLDLTCDGSGEAWSTEPAGDCDDARAEVNPGATERCNGYDDDCDALVDLDAVDPLTWYLDIDGDSWGVATETRSACERPDGFAASAGDCDDSSSGVHPGALELWYDGIDQDCDDNDCDQDLDGFDAELALCGGSDCDDEREEVHPDAEELCLDGIDNNCDGIAEEPDACDLGLASAALTLRGEARTDYAGSAVLGAGDLDLDGYDDLLVGAYYADRGSSNSGAAYLVRGPRSGILGLGSADAVFTGEAANDYAGCALAASDLSGDGRPEVIIGASGNDTAGSNAGAIYVLSGEDDGTIPLGSALARLQGESTYDQAGWSLAGGFDLDDDGFEDLLVGAPYANPGSRSDAGAAWLFHGPLSGTASLSSASVVYQGVTSNDFAGWAVSRAGDTDGDGGQELLVGAIGQDASATMAGAVYLVNPDLEGSISLSSAEARLVGEDSYDGAGVSLAALGDQDGDGYDDILIGAWQGATYGSYTGATIGLAYVVNGPVAASTLLSDADALFLGEAAGDYAGFSVACPGDLDLDGLGDVLIGAWGASTGSRSSGVANLFTGPFSGSLSMGSPQVRLFGTNSDDQAGYAVSGAGDFDGDAFPDLLVGANREDSSETNAGAGYLISGSAL